MLVLDNSDILQQTNQIEKLYLSGAMAPLYFDKFMQKTMTKLAEAAGEVYPKEIRIAKSLDRLLKKDYEPAQIIRLDKQPMFNGEFPIWFGSSQEEVVFRGAGYKNGDSRYPSTFALGDKVVHGIMGGSTGTGKSVAINAMVTGIAMEYAPWEVNLVLLDAKVVGFARYAGTHVFPHIRSIGATTDTGYLISVFEMMKNEMMVRNAAFAAAGVEGIIDFRDKYKLTMPRIIIFGDEIQAMLAQAGNKAKYILEILDLYGRLGRSTGIHIFLASQEPDAIPDATLNNVLGRMALGCAPKVSTKLIGNEAAKNNLGTKGRLIINTKHADADTKDNLDFRVPLQTKEMFYSQKELIHDLGGEYNFRVPLSYYDERFMIEWSDLEERIKPLIKTKHKIILGEPSFVLNNEEGFVTLDMSGKEIENIYIVSNTYKNLARHLYQIKTSFKHMGRSVIHNVFHTDDDLVGKVGFGEISGNIREFRDWNDETTQFYLNNIYRRLLCLKADEYVFTGQDCNDSLDDLFYKAFEKGSPQDTELNRKRYFALHGYLDQTEFSEPLGLAGVPSANRLDTKCEIASSLIHLYTNLKLQSDRMLYDKLPPVYNWIIGPEKIIGIGRSSKGKNHDALEKFMMDAARANIRFIIAGTTFDEIAKIAMVSRYCILDSVEMSVGRQFKIADFPESCPPMLAILFDRFGEVKESKKFKKLAYDGEIFV